MLELFYIFLVASFSLIGFHIYRLTSLMHYFFFLFSIYLFLLWFVGKKIVIEIDFKIQYINITSVYQKRTTMRESVITIIISLILKLLYSMF